MDIDFNIVMKKYQERISALMHANVLLECQVEMLQAQLQPAVPAEPLTNGHKDVVTDLADVQVEK